MSKASQHVAFVLRHHPESIGITLDDQGWADIDAVVEGINRTRPMTREKLLEIVRRDDSGRYSVSSDGTKIRANQGHSECVAVDIDFEEALPPAVLYHGTAEQNIASIEKLGILSMKRQYVHMYEDPEKSREKGGRHGKPVVFAIDTVKMLKDGYRFCVSENSVWQIREVPPIYISLI